MNQKITTNKEQFKSGDEMSMRADLCEPVDQHASHPELTRELTVEVDAGVTSEKLAEMQARVEELQTKIITNKEQFESENEMLMEVSMRADQHETTIGDATFSLKDRMNLIETKLLYESQLVELKEMNKQLQARLDAQGVTTEESSPQLKSVELQTSMCPADATFTMEDRVTLIETKLSYEKEIVELAEKIEQLEAAIQQSEENEMLLKREFEQAKDRFQQNLQEQETKAARLEDDVNKLKRTMLEKDSHYGGIIATLESTIGK